MLVFLYRLLFGYVTVRVMASHPEKLLNLCVANGIGIWRVVKKGDRLYFKIGIASFRKLRLYKRSLPGRVHITKKTGLPFFLARNRLRYGMVAGFLLFCATLQLLSGRVWNICISGNQTVSVERVVQALDDIGICEGTPVGQIDPEQKRNELLLAEPGLSWAAINIEGSKLTVEVTETKQSQQKEEAPSNIKATEAGVIRRMEVISGVSVVQIGQAVERGQLLVSGVIEYEDQSASFVQAKGRIFAEVEKTFTVVQPLTVTEKLRSGEVKRRRVLHFFGYNIPLYLGTVPQPYESVLDKQLLASDQPYLPIGVVSRSFYTVVPIRYHLTESVAKERAEKQLQTMLKKELGTGEILHRSDEWRVENQQLKLICKITCMKDIGFEEKLQLDTRN